MDGAAGSADAGSQHREYRGQRSATTIHHLSKYGTEGYTFAPTPQVQKDPSSSRSIGECEFQPKEARSKLLGQCDTEIGYSRGYVRTKR